MRDGHMRDLLLEAEACLAAADARLAPTHVVLKATLQEELDLVRAIRLSIEDDACHTRLDAWAPLTGDERRHAIRLARGMTTAAIASDLGVKPGTVRRVLRRIVDKLKLSHRNQLVAWALSDSRRRVAVGCARLSHSASEHL